MYNDVKAGRQGASAGKNTLDKVVKAVLSLNWTGPWKISAVGPSATAPDDRPKCEKRLCLVVFSRKCDGRAALIGPSVI